MTTRRDFLRTAGIITAGAALLNPFEIFAQSGKTAAKTAASKKMVLTFRPYDAQMRHVFTIANSSRTTTQLVFTEIAYDGYVGYGEAAMARRPASASPAKP
jgi:hypothetical protein